MTPTNSTAKTGTVHRQSQNGSVAKPTLERPLALRANKNATNVPVASQNLDLTYLLNELCKKVDTLTIAVGAIQNSVDTLQGQMTVLSDRQVENLEKVERNHANVIERFDTLERQPIPVIQTPATNPNFSEEMIIQAREQLNVDLTVPLIYKEKNVLTMAPFNRNNINIYGTRILGKIFKKRELAAGTVDPVRTRTPPLDPIRLNLIKACYLKKLKSIEAFVDNWDTIAKSFRQKCLDMKKYLLKHPEDAEDEDDEDSPTNNLDQEFEEEDQNEPLPNQQQETSLINRDVSMHSLPLV
ncbi:unnamed protein product [Brachionus calyciflorus]|uniref:Uncharacterized protein n=1 Tax=Brachionus calyciflorus TaxID=104777 RepID=A0A814MWY9_9BILA|nr:unnamed protein product [Brachionus calyciflorus]